MPIMNMRRKITRELVSIIPGEPAVHLNAFIHNTIHIIRNMSPGRTRDCFSPNREKFHVYASSWMLNIERLVRLIMENAIIPPARNWYMNCVLAGRLKMSSNAEPTIRMNNATKIGRVKLSILKKRSIAIKAGTVIASPPNAGVTPSCRAFI